MPLSDIQVNSQFLIPTQEISLSFCKAGGPGGQNVNKVNTKVLLRWHFSQNTTLPDALRERIKVCCSQYLTSEGDILVSSSTFRTQSRNTDECVEKLANAVKKAFEIPKKRVRTRTPKSAQESRIETKKKTARKKKWRGKVSGDGDF